MEHHMVMELINMIFIVRVIIQINHQKCNSSLQEIMQSDLIQIFMQMVKFDCHYLEHGGEMLHKIGMQNFQQYCKY